MFIVRRLDYGGQGVHYVRSGDVRKLFHPDRYHKNNISKIIDLENQFELVQIGMLLVELRDSFTQGPSGKTIRLLTS